MLFSVLKCLCTCSGSMSVYSGYKRDYDVGYELKVNVYRG